jgi:hypothetical protein
MYRQNGRDAPLLPEAVSRKMLKANQGLRRDTRNRTVEWFRGVLICTFVALAHAPGTWAQPVLSDEARLSPSPLELLLEQRDTLQLTDEHFSVRTS